MPTPRSERFACGADPEFILMCDNGEAINSSIFFNEGSAMGCDGHNFTGELRPAPASDAVGLVANIATIIQDGMVENPALEKLWMLAGHYKAGRAIGGHIHINGVPKRLHEEVNSFVEPVLVKLSDTIDELEERKQRRQSYGNGFRSQTDWRIEYRMPGSWLLSPGVAFLNIFVAETMSRTFMSTQEGSFSAAIYKKEAAKAAKTMEGIIHMVEKFEGHSDGRVIFDRAVEMNVGTTLPWGEDFKTLGWLN